LKSVKTIPQQVPKSTPFGQVEFFQRWSGTSTARVPGDPLPFGSSASAAAVCVWPGWMSLGIHARRHTCFGAGTRSGSQSDGNTPLRMAGPSHSRV
jgi:hypothetical protein